MSPAEIAAREFDAWLDLIEADHRDILEKGLYKDPEESSFNYRNRVNLLSAVKVSVLRALQQSHKSNISHPIGDETAESGIKATRAGTDELAAKAYVYSGVTDSMLPVPGTDALKMQESAFLAGCKHARAERESTIAALKQQLADAKAEAERIGKMSLAVVEREYQAEIARLKQEIAGGEWEWVKRVDHLKAQIAEARHLLGVGVDSLGGLLRWADAACLRIHKHEGTNKDINMSKIREAEQAIATLRASPLLADEKGDA